MYTTRMEKTSVSKGQQNGQHKTQPQCDQFDKLFGFKLSDLHSIDSVYRLMCRPTDPSGLGVMRIIFGVLMMIDIWQERGLSNLVEDYGDQSLCRFPLFDWLQPLPLVWMYIVYLVLFIGEVGILLGLFYRFSCMLFIVSYWYLLFIDKTTWNNHSYLFGLVGVLLLLTDTNRYWSLDGLIFKKKRHAHIPLWNYAIFRFQIFIVYFIAGIKKLDTDWVSGYSMHAIASHFVFSPFRFLLSEEQVSLYIVHFGGLIIDLTIAFFLFFDKTRPLAFTFGGAFHVMNSQLFSIGMFPFMMLSTMPLFCYPDWPRTLLQKIPRVFSLVLPAAIEVQPSDHCVYDKKMVKSEEKQPSKTSVSRCSSPPPTRLTRYHRAMVGIVMIYMTTQCLLPYSHGITKGYNHWTQGLYGYSWDMMVHTWKLQHIKVTYIDKYTREEGYLDPQAWTLTGRWSNHPDTIKQYAHCVEERLAMYNITDVEIHLDIWKALNDRFQQRAVDPRVDMLEVPWSPFRSSPWLLSLLVDLSDWRTKLAEIQSEIFAQDTNTDVVFVADFPGLYLENFVQEDLGNTSITVLQGQVVVELADQGKNYTLNPGDTMKLPANEFHNVHTVSDTPSCFMYIFVNTTYVQLIQTMDKYQQILNNTFTGTDTEANSIISSVESGPNQHLYQQYMLEKENVHQELQMSLWQQWILFFNNKLTMLSRSIKFTLGAVRSLVTGEPFEVFLNASFTEEIEQRKALQQQQYETQ